MFLRLINGSQRADVPQGGTAQIPYDKCIKCEKGVWMISRFLNSNFADI